MDEKIVINTANGQRKISVLHATLKRLLEKALKGDQKAIIKIIEFDLRFNPENLVPDFNPDAPKTGVLVVPGALTEEEFDEYAKTVLLPKEARQKEED